jgi:hypothetical protein
LLDGLTGFPNADDEGLNKLEKPTDVANEDDGAFDAILDGAMEITGADGESAAELDCGAPGSPPEPPAQEA